MTVIVITGDREWGDDRYPEVHNTLSTVAHRPDILVVLGDAEGVDALALRACKALRIPYVREEAHWRDDPDGRWKGLGRAAGPERNGRMVAHATDPFLDECWWFHDNLSASRGTKNCTIQALRKSLNVRSWRHVLALGR